MSTKYNFSVFFIVILLVSALPACSKKEVEVKELKPIRYIGNYNKDFNDVNDLHLEAAAQIGIDPIENREAAEHMKKKLKEIKSNRNYEVEELTHSIPFLVPKAVDLLKTIGQNFADSLYNLNAPHYKLIVTSVTRTIEDVNRLSKRNYNASLNSAHMYGTTVDISWRRFIKDCDNPIELTEEQLKMVFAAVLRDLQKEGACYIKHERKQACFHITAR